MYFSEIYDIKHTFYKIHIIYVKKYCIKRVNNYVFENKILTYLTKFII